VAGEVVFPREGNPSLWGLEYQIASTLIKPRKCLVPIFCWTFILLKVDIKAAKVAYIYTKYIYIYIYN